MRPRATGARSGGRPGLKGWPGGAAKHGGGVRSMGGRGGGGRGLGRWRQGSGPVVTGGSRKIVNSDWREVDEGHLPVPYRSDGSLKKSTDLFIFSRLLS